MVVSDFPIGINPNEIKGILSSVATQREIKHIKQTFCGRKIILGVDRLDYIKGISLKLLAFDALLHDHPELKEKVILLQVAIPTRAEVDEYKALRREVEHLVGKINGKHGTITYTPVQYLYRPMEPKQLYALYAVSDICIISSVRDGFNMVSYEYVASQESCEGVLLLSQYAGAGTLLKSATQFNPWDLPRFSETIFTGLNMPLEERKKRMEKDRAIVQERTSMKWGKSFLDALRSCELEEGGLGGN